MADSFMEQIKPIGDSSWMGALNQKAQIKYDALEKAQKFLQSTSPASQELGASILRDYGYTDDQIRGQRKANPVEAATRAIPKTPTTAIPKAGEAGYAESKAFQSEGSNQFDQRLKDMGVLTQKDAQGNITGYYKGGAKLSDSDVSDLFGGLENRQGEVATEADFTRMLKAGQGDTNVFMPDKKMAAQIDRAVASQKDMSDLTSSGYFDKDAVSRAQEVAQTSGNPSTTGQYGLARRYILNELSADRLKPEQATMALEQLAREYPDQTFTGIQGAPTRYDVEEAQAARKNRGGTGASDLDSRPYSFKAPDGTIVQGEWRIPKSWKGDVIQAANNNPEYAARLFEDTFINRGDIPQSVKERYFQQKAKIDPKTKKPIKITENEIFLNAVKGLGQTGDKSMITQYDNLTDEQRRNIKALQQSGLSREQAIAKVSGAKQDIMQ